MARRGFSCEIAPSIKPLFDVRLQDIARQKKSALDLVVRPFELPILVLNDNRSIVADLLKT